jgi:hypothetical protein
VVITNGAELEWYDYEFSFNDQLKQRLEHYLSANTGA